MLAGKAKSNYPRRLCCTTAVAALRAPHLTDRAHRKRGSLSAPRLSASLISSVSALGCPESGRGTPVCTVMPGDPGDGTLWLLQPQDSLAGHCGQLGHSQRRTRTGKTVFPLQNSQAAPGIRQDVRALPRLRAGRAAPGAHPHPHTCTHTRTRVGSTGAFQPFSVCLDATRTSELPFTTCRAPASCFCA